MSPVSAESRVRSRRREAWLCVAALWGVWAVQSFSADKSVQAQPVPDASSLSSVPERGSSERPTITLRGDRAAPARAEALAAEFGPEFVRRSTTHFVVLSNADPEWTQRQIALLERTRHEVARLARRLSLPVRPPQEKILCILFGEHADFTAFARDRDDVAETWIAGYYASRPNYIVFYDSMDGPAFREAAARLDEYEAEIARFRSEHGIGGAARVESVEARQAEAMERRLASERARVAGLAEVESTARTIHEAAHALFFNTGVQTWYREYPFWITEGLATSFETDAPESAFGPDFDRATRRERFEALLAEGALLPLSEFVQYESVPAGSGVMADVMYHQACALVSWLSRHRKDGLSEYLRVMGAEDESGGVELGMLEPADHLRVFERCFGEVAALEGAWLADERRRMGD